MTKWKVKVPVHPAQGTDAKHPAAPSQISKELRKADAHAECLPGPGPAKDSPRIPQQGYVARQSRTWAQVDNPEVEDTTGLRYAVLYARGGPTDAQTAAMIAICESRGLVVHPFGNGDYFAGTPQDLGAERVDES